jgi:transcriptional regulator with XRE-family HTH domain
MNSMSASSADPTVELIVKIARLVEERGWNQEDFARVTGLNRQTVRHILLQHDGRRLRNATVSACAKALGLAVSELRTQPLERLLPRMNGDKPAAKNEDQRRRLYDEATQPELLAWLDRNPERANELTPAEIDELISAQGTGGPLTLVGVQHFVHLIERKRRIVEKIHAIAGTEYVDLLEQFVMLLYEKVQPYRERT